MKKKTESTKIVDMSDDQLIKIGNAVILCSALGNALTELEVVPGHNKINDNIKVFRKKLELQMAVSGDVFRSGKNGAKLLSDIETKIAMISDILKGSIVHGVDPVVEENIAPDKLEEKLEPVTDIIITIDRTEFPMSHDPSKEDILRKLYAKSAEHGFTQENSSIHKAEGDIDDEMRITLRKK